ncbi:uncharacterized protein LOC118207243 isoform X2 [Anguilla anguilla]|uniref:uncharacterized protein LOC118207243 isoform X2 n=1 Tax=Anguilla anguilla TaxID=7936 RepID=UPI0015B029FF|nr:uncharacterized protein LOC118207243 isoform X2 [Anguilla anguilla]
MSEKRPGKGRRMGSSRKQTRGNRIQREEGKPEGIEGLVEEDGLTYTGVKEGGGADEATPHKPAKHESKLLLPSMEIDPSHESSTSAHLQQSDSLVQTSVEPALMTEAKDLVHYEEPVGSSINDIQQSQTQMECRTEFKSPVALTHLYESEKIVSTKGHENPICSRNPESENTLPLESVEKSRVNVNSSPEEASENTGECLRVDEVQDTSVPIPDRREKRRKMGSTRKSSRRAEVQTETGEEEDVITGQEREEGKDSSLVEEELGSEITATSGEIQTEKQDEKRIHQNTDQDKENERQVGDRKTSGISTRPPEISDDSEQAEHSTFSVEKEREDKEESNEEREIEQVGTYHTPDISDYSDQAEHSTFVNEELHTDTPLTFGRTEGVGQSEAESTKHENMFEDTVILDQLNQSEDSLLTEKDSVLSVMLTDTQQRSPELEDHSQQSEEGETRNVEENSPGEDSKGDVLFTLAEESGNEKIKENKEKEEERNSENGQTVIGDGQSPTLLEQNQDFTTAEQEQTVKLQDTQLPLVVENIPFSGEGEINVQEGEGHQGESIERGIQPDAKDRPADTMEYEDTTLAQETALPVPARRERRRKMGSTRKSSRRAEVQTDRGEEEDVVMGQEREEGEESSLVEEELGSEITATTGEIQTEKQDEKRIHLIADEEKEMEYQVGDRESSGISAHTPEPSEFSEQAEHSTFSVEKEREDKEESNEEREMEQVGTYHTPDISDYSDQAEHSTFVNEELHTDTPLTFGRTEGVGQSEAESTKHENMFEDTVILDQLNQSEDSRLTEKDSALSVMLTDTQQRSPELEDHSQQSEEGETRNVEENSPGEDSKGDVLFTLAEESGNEKIKENKEKEEERNSENGQTVISDGQSPTLLEQNQDFTTAEQEQTVKLQDTQLPLVVENIPFSGEGEINVQEGEGHQGESIERGIQPDAKDRPADTMEYEDTTLAQETALPVPARRERRRKMGSTRKSSRRAEVQTDRGEEEDVVMGQEREEGEESSLVEEELGSEITATTGEIQTEKQDEKRIHLIADEEKEMEYQVGDRESSGISAHTPEPSEFSEQAEHSTFSVEKEREDKEESNEEREMEQVGTYHTPDISDYSDQAEHSTFVNEELHTDTPLTFGRTEGVGQSEAESTKHENMFEDTVILDQLNQSEDSLLTEKDSVLSVMLTDTQQRSPELEDHSQQSEEGETRNVEENSPGEDSKGDVLFTLAEESGNEKIKENKEKEEERNSENGQTVISDGQSPTLLEQNQDFTTAEQEQTVKLQDTQLPLVVENIPFSGEGEINVQEGEGHQGESIERGIQPDAKDRSADTMEYEDTTLAQETALPVPARRERRRKMGSTRKSSRRSEVQTDRGEEEDVVMGQEREEGEESSLVEEELGSEITATTGEIQTEKQDEKRIHLIADEEKEMEYQVGDRESSGISAHTPEPSEFSEQAEHSTFSVEKEREDKEESNEEREMEQVGTYHTPDISDYSDQAEHSTFVNEELHTDTPLTFGRTEGVGQSEAESTKHENTFEDTVILDQLNQSEDSRLTEKDSALSVMLTDTQQRSPELEDHSQQSEEGETRNVEENSPGEDSKGDVLFTLAEESGNEKIKENKEKEEERNSENGQTVISDGQSPTLLEQNQDFTTAEQEQTVKLQDTQLPLVVENIPFSGEGEINVQEGEGHQGESIERGIQPDAKDRPADTMEYEDTTLAQETALPVPARRERRRKMGSTRKSSRRAEVQTDRGEEEDVVMGQEREEGEESSLVEEELGSETGAPSGELQAEKQKEKRIHQNTDKDKENESQVGDRKTSGISTRPPEISDDSEQAEHSTFSVENEREDKEESNEEREMEQVGTYHTPDISDYSDQAEHSTFVNEELHTDTPLTFGRTEGVGQSEAESTKHENMFEDTVILDQLNQSEGSLFTEKDSALSVMLTDTQQRSPELEDHSQQSEEGETRNVEENSPGEDSKGDVLFTLAEESGNEKIKENKEKEEERNSENGQTVISDGQSPTLLEQNQDFTTAEQEQTAKLQDTQLPLVVENIPFSGEGEINVQEGEGHQGESAETGIQPDAKDRSADTMEYEDTTAPQETALPVPARRERRRKMGSTRKSSRRAEVQADRGEEEDVVMGQEREEGEESSLVEEELGSETGAPSGELQAEKQKEKRIHLIADEEKEMEYQVGDRESSGISAHTPEPSEFSEQAEHSTFSVENEREDKEESKEEREMEKFGTYHTPDISDYSDQAEHSTFVKEELHTDTPLTFGRTENVGQSEAESTKHENMFEDTVILDQLNQSEDNLLTEKDSALSVMLTDAQQRSPELKDYSQQSEEGEVRNVEENSLGEDSKGDVLFTPGEESGNEKIKENKEKEEERNSENSHIVVSDIHSPTLLEQTQNFTTAEQVQTVKLQDTQLPLVVENIPVRCDGELNVQEGEGHQGESVERRIQPDSKDRSADTMEYKDTTLPQETALPVPARRERRRKMGSTRKSSRRAEVQTERGEEEDVVMGQEREEGEESSLVEEELGSEITATSGEIQTEKQDDKRIHQNTDQDKENDESQVGDRKTSGISTYSTEVSDENMPVRCEGEINVQEGEGHQGESVERGIQPDSKDRSADTMEYKDTTLPQETALPVPAKTERRRKLGSTRKSTRRAEVQTEKGEEEDVMRKENSSLLEDELGLETAAPSGELQVEQQKEKRIHLTTNQEKGMEYQVGDRESSGISAHTPEPSEVSQQAEHSTFSVEKEREDKDESKEEREMEKFGTYHTPDILDYSDQAEHSTFVKEKLHTDTPLTFGRTESVGQSEAEGTKHENIFEGAVILYQQNQSEDSLLTAKDSDCKASQNFVSDNYSPAILEQIQDFTTAEQEQTVKLQDTQLPLVVENIPFSGEGEINVQEGEGHQGERIERGIQPDAKDRPADTLEYEDTTLPQETSLPVPARRERRRKMGSTRKSSRRAEVQADRGEEEDVVMGQEREEGEESSLVEEELGSEITATSREIQTEKQDDKIIHQNTDQDKENDENQVGDRKTSGISTYPTEVSDENMPVRCEGKISVQEEEGHQGQSDKRGAEAIDKSADIMMSQNTSLPQDTSLPVPNRRERRRKLGSTRKSSRRAEAQTETGEEEDVMGQEREEDKESSLLDKGLGSEIAAPSDEMHAEKPKEMNIHQATEHSTFSVEKERSNKEEREEREMEQVGMYHTPDISNYSAQVEHSFEKELASISNTQTNLGWGESVGFSVTESTKYENLIEDTKWRSHPDHTQQLCQPKNVVHHSADEHDSSAVPHRRRKMGSTRKGLLRSANQGEGEQLREQREKTEGEKGEMGEMLEGNDVNDTHKEEKGIDKDEALEREIMSSVQSPPFLEPPESSAVAGKQDKASPGVKKKLGSRRKGRSSVWKGDRDLGQANEMGVEEDSKASAVLQRIQEVFHHWDPEEKGFITWDHMQGLSGELGLSVEELRQVFDRLDEDRDGLVTPEDVTAGFREFMQLQQPRARPAAAVYQSDGSILPEEEDDGERKLFLSKLGDLRAYSLLQEHIQQHSVGVKELYEEMERQIRTEKERIKEESLEKSRSELAKLEEELDQKNSQIQTLNAVQSQLEGRLHALQRQQQQSGVEKQELFRANQELEEQLERIRAQLQESLSNLHALRSAHSHKPTHPHLLSLTDRAGQTEDSSRPEVLNLDSNVQTEKRHISHEAVVLERSGSQLDHSSPQGRYTGAQDEARRRVISIEEDPMPDLLTGGQALPYQNQGEALWEKQRGQAWGERDSLSSVSHSPSALDLLYNVVLVGNSSVGKTCFMKRFQSGDFNPDLCATVGLDSCIQTMQVEGRKVILQLWDTAGQERYHSITKQILRKAEGLVLMYDITSSESFLALRSWLSSIQEGAPDDVIIVLLGNKNDSHRREVSFEEGERLAREYSVHFMECSAATGDNVVQAMNNLARMLKQQVEEKQESSITLHKGSPKKKSGCCG